MLLLVKYNDIVIGEGYMKMSEEAVKQTDTIIIDSRQPTEQLATSQTIFATLAQLWKDVIGPFLVIRCLLLVVGMVTIYYILPLVGGPWKVAPSDRILHFPDMLVLMWQHFDSGFYLGIAQTGYDGPNMLHRMSNWAFFPLYPLLIRLVALPFGSDMDTYRLAGLFVANCAALVAVVYLYKLTTLEFGRATAARAVLYLALFPMSFYLSAIYPESLFLALVVSCMYYTRLRRWWLAGLLGGLATLTRPQGVLLAIVVGWEYFMFLAAVEPSQHQAKGVVARILNWLYARITSLARSLTSWGNWLGFVWLALIPGGLVLFSIYSKWKVGAFKAFFMVEKDGWGRQLTNPIPVILRYIQHPSPPNPSDWNFYSLNLLIIFTFCLLLIPIFHKLPLRYGILTLAFLIMPVASGETNSVARYYLAVFPVFMIVAWWTTRGRQERQERWHSLIVASFAILLSVGMVLFTLGIYSIS
jgi:Gpi18-like mannosyltransferase